MKRCPRCDKTYPDAETFCETDGTALVQAGPAFAESAGRESDEGTQVECPVCGGKAQPGELICNFCGARLGVESAAETYTPPPPRTASSKPTTVRRDPSPSMRITGKMPGGDDEDEQEMLNNTFAQRKPNSRLSCQIPVTEELNGLVVTTPEAQQ